MYKYLIILVLFFYTSFAFTQNEKITISGNIIKADSEEPVPGIKVSLPGISSATTNENGQFSIEVPDSNVTLRITGKGYQAKLIPLKGKKEIEVKLHEAAFNSIYNEVKMPYSIQPKSNVIYATGTVDGTYTEPFHSPEGIMQGKMNGLNIINRSGIPGIGASLFLRGYNSILANAQPLIVIDGMIYDYQNYSESLLPGYLSNALFHIDVKDIENITLIKDGNSYYGSKSGNGVILINTMHAKELATKIDFYTHAGIKYKPNYIPMMDAENYRSYLTEQLASNGYSSDKIENLDYMNDDKTESGYYKYHNNTNWQDEIYNNGIEQNYYLRVLGGDQIAKYGLSVGFLKTDGIVNNTSLSRYNTRFNSDVSVTSKLKINTNLAFSYNTGSMFDDGINNRTSPTYLGLIKPPIFAPYKINDEGETTPDIETDYVFFSNPAALIENMMGDVQNYRFFGSAGVNYKIIEGLNIGTIFGLVYDNQREDIFIPENGVTPEILSNVYARNTAKVKLNKYYSIYSDTKLSYLKRINYNHSFNAVIGMRYNTNTNESDWGKAYNTASDEVKNLSNSVESKNIGGDIIEWKWLSFYSGAEYNMFNKYLISYNISIDGSSNFGGKADGIDLLGRKFGVFPSVGIAWIASSEEFIPTFDIIDLLKLRISYGITGNDNVPYLTNIKYYDSQRFSSSVGLVRGNIPNPYIQWETIKKTNVGLDLAMYNEKITFAADIYTNKTENLLYFDGLNYITGFDYILINDGELKNNGFELNIDSRIIDKTLKWDLGIGFAKYKNEVISLPDKSLETEYDYMSLLAKEGHPVNSFYGYKTNGVFSSDSVAALAKLKQKLSSGNYNYFEGGDVIFEDYFKDSIIDEKDRQIIGDPNPDFTAMLSNSLSWKNFSLSTLFTCTYGFDVFNYLRAKLESGAGFENQTIAMQNRWKYNGQETDMPKATYEDPMGNARFSDRWIEKDIYLIRLKTITLSYNLPVKNEYLNNALIYITANNILSFSNYLGYDPEFSGSSTSLGQSVDYGYTPQYKSIFVGLKIGL